MAITPTQQAIDSLIRLHSPENHEIAFALAILDITLIKIDSYGDSYNTHKVREVLAAYLDGETAPQEIKLPPIPYTEADVYGSPNHTSKTTNFAA